MYSDLTIRITGEAGQGMQTIGRVMCLVFREAGLNLFAHHDYMSRIRGGNNYYQVRISDRPVFGAKEKCDIILLLDGAGLSLHRKDLAGDGLMVVDMDKTPALAGDVSRLHVPMFAMAKENGGSDLFVNAAACGALVALTGLPVDSMDRALLSLFTKKGGAIADTNIKTARLGHDFVRAGDPSGRFHMQTAPSRKEMLVTGNEAVALGAIQAGCKFYSAYPMSPSTGIMEALCPFSEDYGIFVEQAEDEIAAINMVIGASFAGVRAMTATSGGGFALMTEGVSLAAMTETPMVAVVAQRPGPATGFPTRTEQADLTFVINGGHGEFAKAVYSPGTPEEAFSVTFQAFETAEKFQIPVLILTDQHLADSVRNVDPTSFAGLRPQRYVLTKPDAARMKHYRRYAETPSGISPRGIPSWIPGVLYADSDEHTEQGHITEDAEIRSRMVEKRLYKKMSGLIREIRNPTALNMRNARVVLLGFGSTFGVLKEAVEKDPLRELGAIHLSQIWPFPVEAVRALLRDAEKIVTVENNAGGQLAKLLRQETGLTVNGSILKYDGRPFTAEEILARLE